MEEEVNSGARSVERQDDSLSIALGNPEHPGRVRGVGAYRGWKDVFNGPKPRRKSRAKVNKDEIVAQIRKEVSAEYAAKIEELETRLRADFTAMAQPAEQAPPTPTGVRRSSQASGTFGYDLDRLKVITTCSYSKGNYYLLDNISI